MRNARNSGFKSVRTAIAAAVNKPILWTLHGGDNTARNFAASNPVAIGYPTVVTLGTASTALAGTWVKVSGVVGMTALNGYWRVLWIDSATARVALDVDSSTFAAYTSGGTVTPTVVVDEYKQTDPQDLQGTVTGVYSNPVFGLTAHSAGTNTLRSATSVSALDLTTHAGCVAVGCDLYFTANPSADEFIFSLGVDSATGNNTAAGAITLRLRSDGQLSFNVRPQAAADGGGSNTFLFSGVLATSTKKSVAMVLDLSQSTWVQQLLIDGAYTKGQTVTMTGSIGGPASIVGWAIGSSISAALAQAGKLGASGSGARVENLMYWRTTKGVNDTLRAVADFQRRKRLTGLMA